jgi:hypothetical protein
MSHVQNLSSTTGQPEFLRSNSLKFQPRREAAGVQPQIDSEKRRQDGELAERKIHRYTGRQEVKQTGRQEQKTERQGGRLAEHRGHKPRRPTLKW